MLIYPYTHINVLVLVTVDVSGSMGGEATIPGAENSGLTLLDITKHALKTVITSLQEQDRISLVSYSNAATVVCGLTPMTAAGKARVLGLVDTLYADGMTNLWDGLKKGLDTLTEASTAGGSSSGVRNASVFLLTGDGISFYVSFCVYSECVCFPWCLLLYSHTHHSKYSIPNHLACRWRTQCGAPQRTHSDAEALQREAPGAIPWLN